MRILVADNLQPQFWMLGHGHSLARLTLKPSFQSYTHNTTQEMQGCWLYTMQETQVCIVLSPVCFGPCIVCVACENLALCA